MKVRTQFLQYNTFFHLLAALTRVSQEKHELAKQKTTVDQVVEKQKSELLELGITSEKLNEKIVFLQGELVKYKDQCEQFVLQKKHVEEALFKTQDLLEKSLEQCKQGEDVLNAREASKNEVIVQAQQVCKNILEKKCNQTTFLCV